jgi:ATP-dependent helicase/nuclease subunit A
MIQYGFDFGPEWDAPDDSEQPEQPEQPEPPEGKWTPPDQTKRNRILTELDRNLLVEAGAGSGKTTSMVGRMVELVRSGREVERVAAVTFTRKAAAELRERFQEALESAYRTALADGDEAGRERFGAALDAIDRCFLGTVHSFCARLLRERPLEAGIPPEFQEVSGVDEDRLVAESWNRFLERLAARPRSRLVRALAENGLRPQQLRRLFREVAENLDVRFPAPAAPALDPTEVAVVRRRVERLMDASEGLLPAEDHPRGPDALQKKVRRLKYQRWIVGWANPLDFLLVLEEALQGRNDVTQNRWASDKAGKRAAKELGQEWEDLCAPDGQPRRLLEAWWARRYRVAIRFARAAAGVYAADRIRLGQLTFQDLLIRATELLRSHAGARADLGERYRWLLVDEFQDTDPVQAEMLLLLAADPSEDPAPGLAGAGVEDDARSRWLHVTPRPGALFVVGDPKQSIYRFRRADIAVYNQVKQRFREFGDTLDLVTSFRSYRPIERFVNRAFEGRFPPTETDYQAAFSPLRVRPDRTAPSEGVYWYGFEAAGGYGGFSGGRISEPEAALLASWVRGRLEGGARRPGDFLVLATRKSELAVYARALEAQGVPVQVTGAGVGAERELTELILLLSALADPDDPVLTLAVLEGLFFGLSHEQLYAFARAGGRLSFLAPTPDAAGGASPVADALATLRQFWNMARRAPADVAVPRIADQLGILPWAAAGELGSTRAGAVVYALDALRVAARERAASLPEAIEILETALEQEVDAPLVPGEVDAVRVMNLHKAKGLEAPVVVLAYPASLGDHPVRRHIARDTAGRAVGWLQVLDPTRPGDRIIAQPADWANHDAAERPYQAAEEVRKLYVAATRAAEELVIARCDRTADSSCWADLHDALDTPGVAAELEIAIRPPPVRETLDEPVQALTARMDHADATRRRLALPTFRAAAVSTRVHATGTGAVRAPGTDTGDAGADARGGVAAAGGDAAGTPPPADIRILYLSGPEFRAPDAPPPDARGTEWGSAVHRALETAMEGAEGDVLRSACRAALVEFERPMSPDGGDPAELDELVALVTAVRAHDIWTATRSARIVLVEAPFSLALPADEARRIGIVEPADLEVLDGTIDLAFQDQEGRWTVVDFKTDARQDPHRHRAYEQQARLYALALAAIAAE